MNLSKRDLALLNALLVPFEERRINDGSATLGGMCVVVSYVAAKILNDDDFLSKQWLVQRGRYGQNLAHSDSYADGHLWLVSSDGTYLLDLTADQFGQNRIYLGLPTDPNYFVSDDDGEWPIPRIEGWLEASTHSYNSAKRSVVED